LTLSTFVVFANHGGAEGDLHFWGGSHVIRPDGAISAKATYGAPDLLVADLDLASLRNQRLILPFRRDDSLALTVEMGRRVLHHKAKRRDGFLSALASHRVPAAPGTPGEAGRPQHLGLDGVDAAFNDRDQPAPYPDPSR